MSRCSKTRGIPSDQLTKHLVFVAFFVAFATDYEIDSSLSAHVQLWKGRAKGCNASSYSATNDDNIISPFHANPPFLGGD
ncbi:hypothetical protein FPQ18DRAFT_403790 [Pyronema domesticum]|nr:hypothetical protein FPQ18DRAFT_403790 [Pyronema domesticum]